MGLLQKYEAPSEAYTDIRRFGADPFNMRFDTVISPTEAELNGGRVILIGTNNYLGLTFDPECVEASVEAVRNFGTGTTGSRSSTAAATPWCSPPAIRRTSGFCRRWPAGAIT